MDIYIVYNDENLIKRLGDATFVASPFFHFIKDTTLKGKKEAIKLKSQFGAKLTPFIAVYNKEIPIKAFYTEASTDVLEDLINYLQ